MDQLIITDLSEDQFVGFLENISHRVALRDPLKRLWVDQTDANCLRVTTRYSDKKNPSARIAYATRLPVVVADVQFVNLLWLEGADWFLVELRSETEVKYYHFAIPTSCQYKANALAMRLDTLKGLTQ